MQLRGELVDEVPPGGSNEAIIDSSSRTLQRHRRTEDFLLAFFRSLDGNKVRYCVLHSWEELPHQLSSDLDVAVHPDDRAKLAAAFQELCDAGYDIIQIINYFILAYAFQFCWWDASAMSSIAIDVIFKHQRGPFIKPGAKEIVAGRRRHGSFWIPSSDSEFTYLLARKTYKGSVSAEQERRLNTLISQLGVSRARELADKLFRPQLTTRILHACANATLDQLLPKIRKQASRAAFTRNPISLSWEAIREKVRLICRWFQPTGLFIAALGPDGSGKSTLIQNLIQQIGPLWRDHKLFHWRPMLLWRGKSTRDTTQPHSVPPRSSLASSIRALAHLLDYWFGYWFVIRPFTARTGLVIFDRYFDDMLVDPRRYRYGGPLWLLRILQLLVPRPDLTLVLDAPEEIVLARKQEVEPTETQRQRKLYLQCARDGASMRIINTTGSISLVTDDAVRAITQYLARRVEHQNRSWFGPIPSAQCSPATRP